MPDPSAEFDRDLVLTESGPGAYAAQLRPGWVVGDGINGGSLLATVGHAVRRSSSHPDPFAISAHYLSTVTPGPAAVTTRCLRQGRSQSAWATDLAQDGQVRITALATYGDLDALPGDVETTATEPELPALEQCWSLDRAPEE